MDVQFRTIYKCTYLFRDGGKGKSTVTLNFPATMTDPNDPDGAQIPTPILTIRDWSEEMAHKLDDLSLGGLESYTISLGAINKDYVKPDKDVDVEEKATFFFRTKNGYLTEVSIPAFDESNLEEDGETVNTRPTSLTVMAFVNAMTDPWGPDLLEPCDARGDDIVMLTEAYKTHIGSQKQSGKRKG